MHNLSIRITEQSAIVVAEHTRRGCPARQPSPKKSPSFRIPVGGFPPARGYNSESYPPFLNVKNCVGQVALTKNRLLFDKR
jgi:hypothetical protein